MQGIPQSSSGVLKFAMCSSTSSFNSWGNVSQAGSGESERPPNSGCPIVWQHAVQPLQAMGSSICWSFGVTSGFLLFVVKCMGFGAVVFAKTIALSLSVLLGRLSNDHFQFT
jgi:hypothetical protein